MARFVLNFKRQFAAAVETGAKRQTIRANRKDNKRPQVGDVACCYTGLRTLFSEFLPLRGISATALDMSDLVAVKSAMRPETALIWAETPSNPLLAVADIAALAEIAKAQGARLVCDNTFATPALQQPLALGADAVMHSTTKYLGGHSDVLGGAVVTNDLELAEQVQPPQQPLYHWPSRMYGLNGTR